MKKNYTNYIDTKENGKSLWIMIGLSSILHVLVILFIILQPAKSSSRNTIIASYAPVKLTGSIVIPKQGKKNTKPSKNTRISQPSKKKTPLLNKTKKTVPHGPGKKKSRKKRSNKEKSASKTSVTSKDSSKTGLDKENLVPLGTGMDSTNSYGGIIVGTENFLFGWYIDMVTYRIQKNWSPPFEVGKIGKTLQTTVLFEILKDGSPGRILVEQSSGSPLLDDAAINAIRASFPMEPLPRDFPDTILRLHFFIKHTF